jgi:hypothetical protein
MANLPAPHKMDHAAPAMPSGGFSNVPGPTWNFRFGK